jgi:hypothetical protein
MHFNTKLATVVFVLTFCYILWRYSGRYSRTQEGFNSALDHPTKCVDCERQFPPNYAWMGQKTKCYSCEKQAFHMSGGDPSAVFDEHPIKYYGNVPLQGAGNANLGYM